MLSYVVLTVAAAGAPAPLTLDQLLREVSAAPQIRAQQEAVRAAEAGVRVAGAWEDPTVGLMADMLPLRGGPIDPWMEPTFTASLSQPLNLFGRRRLAKEAAGAQADVERAGLRRADWDVRAKAVAGFYELWMNDTMAGVLDEQIRTLAQMHASALARYATGGMVHHDALRADAELSTMRAERASLEEERAAIVAGLNVLRDKPAAAALGPPQLPPVEPLPELPSVLESTGSRPELESMRSMARQMGARRQLAERMYLPMVSVQGQYQQRLGNQPNTVGAQLMFSLPLWWFDRQRNEVEMAEAMQRRAERNLVAMQAMTDADLRMAWSRARAADRSLAALETEALPNLREAVQSSLAAYANGTDNFLSLLESVLALRNLETERVRAVVRREVTRFELSRLLASPLEGGKP